MLLEVVVVKDLVDESGVSVPVVLRKWLRRKPVITFRKQQQAGGRPPKPTSP